jgi:hypothetical protein
LITPPSSKKLLAHTHTLFPLFLALRTASSSCLCASLYRTSQTLCTDTRTHGYAHIHTYHSLTHTCPYLPLALATNSLASLSTDKSQWCRSLPSPSRAHDTTTAGSTRVRPGTPCQRWTCQPTSTARTFARALSCRETGLHTFCHLARAHIPCVDSSSTSTLRGTRVTAPPPHGAVRRGEPRSACRLFTTESSCSHDRLSSSLVSFHSLHSGVLPSCRRRHTATVDSMGAFHGT